MYFYFLCKSVCGWSRPLEITDVSSSWANSSSLNWAIFDEATFCAKFPVGQISALIHHFAGYTQGEIIHEDSSLDILKFSAPDGRTALVGFSKDGTNYNCEIGFDGAVAGLYDPQGNLIKTNSNGGIDIEFSAYPCWVETMDGIDPLLLDGADETLQD